jgi:MraZ protein
MNARAFDRMLYSSVVRQEPDKQGRITIPPILREYAGLDRELAVVGMDTRIEIWDAAAWQTYTEAYEPLFSKLAGDVR